MGMSTDSDGSRGGNGDSRRRQRRGFASLSVEQMKEIASKGGKASHQKGTGHEWTVEEAREAGRKGGMVSRGGRGKFLPPRQG